MEYKTINKLKETIAWPFRVMLYPLKLISFPFLVVIGFFDTNFEDEWDRNYYKKELKTWCKLKKNEKSN